MWIVTYRDFVHSVANIGDEEAFVHPSSKVSEISSESTLSSRTSFRSFCQAGNKNYRWIEFISHWPLWAIYIAHFAMNWSSYIVMVWLPSYLTKTFDADPTNLSFTALPYVMNCLSGVGKRLALYDFFFNSVL